MEKFWYRAGIAARTRNSTLVLDSQRFVVDFLSLFTKLSTAKVDSFENSLVIMHLRRFARTDANSAG
jgi:hypothetical protein